MAIIPADEKVFMVDKRTNTTYGGSQALQDMQQWYTMQDVADSVQPYRVFTALLTQSGGDDSVGQTSGTLVIGRTYYISNDCCGADFTNVGAPNNNLGTSFVATGQIPNAWGGTPSGDPQLTYNTGAPVVTALENTIGNIWFGYFGLGIYIINSDSLFTNNKFALFMGNMVTDVDVNISCTYSNNSVVYMSVAQSNSSSDNLLVNTPIEIRVYN